MKYNRILPIISSIAIIFLFTACSKTNYYSSQVLVPASQLLIHTQTEYQDKINEKTVFIITEAAPIKKSNVCKTEIKRKQVRQAKLVAQKKIIRQKLAKSSMYLPKLITYKSNTAGKAPWWFNILTLLTVAVFIFGIAVTFEYNIPGYELTIQEGLKVMVLGLILIAIMLLIYVASYAKSDRAKYQDEYMPQNNNQQQQKDYMK